MGADCSKYHYMQDNKAPTCFRGSGLSYKYYCKSFSEDLRTFNAPNINLGSSEIKR